jgi:tRNA 2-selenouridine synthase
VFFLFVTIMAIKRISIEDFLELAKTHLVLDVRSPSEYAQAHIPNAQSMPLFTDEERKVVGTTYKQVSRENAIKFGLDYFGPKMRKMVEEVEKLSKVSDNEPHTSKKILVHCWRGGMRSGAVAWLLDLYGFQVYTLEGGYKAYRNYVLQQFEKPLNFKIIGGFTGSGKTPLLYGLQKNNQAIIDLEGLANHKGSALGGIDQNPQPSQEMFENLLGMELSKYDETTQIFLEDESQRIGNMQIPMPMWHNMRKSLVYFMDIPFEERLDYLTKEYGNLPKQELVTAIMRIQKRLGGLETKNAINFLLENNFKESFRILLKYYDKWYEKGLYNRENSEELIKKIEGQVVDNEINTIILMKYISAESHE